MMFHEEIKLTYPLQSKEFESWLWDNYRFSGDHFYSLSSESQIGYYIVFLSHHQSLVTGSLNGTLLHNTFQSILDNFTNLEVDRLKISN